MRSPKAILLEFLEMRPHFGSVWSWFLEPLGRAARHVKVGAGRACKVRSTALGDVWLRLGDSDFRTLLEISRGEYDVCLERLVDPRSVLDLGANVGLSVRLWQRRFASARIVAVEPSPASAQLLRRNVSLCKRPEVVRIIEAAVNVDGQPVFLDQSGDSDSHKVGARGTPVKGIAIAEAIAMAAGEDGMVDLVKMDIEGSERALMECAATWAPMVRHLLIEIHGDYTRELFHRDLARIHGHPSAIFIRSFPGVSTYFVSLNPEGAAG